MEWGLWDMAASFTVGGATIAGAFIVHAFGFNILFYAMSALSFFAFLLLMNQKRSLL